MAYSPLLSIVTAVIEVLVAMWAFTGQGRKSVKAAAAAILLFLASFQILEVLICAATPPSLFFSRIAFMCVAWLPPLGLLLISLLTGRRGIKIIAGLFLSAALILNILIPLTSHFVTRTVCRVVFTLFRNESPLFLAYCIFYWLGLMSMAGFSLAGSRTAPPREQQQLRLMAAGTLGFIIPSLVSVLLFPSLTRSSLPSIMCHYALFLALALMTIIRHEKTG